MTTHSNRLLHETSPYLLQHAHNPVDWYPWGEEALALARRENRPILLSVGYSACHWCHVMAHESFEDGQTAQLMNELFVNIKVDREERPDLDRIYQRAHQLMRGRGGGWPLTMFLTPEQIPFFGGTYFPPEARYGLPGFRELLQRVAAVYHERGEQLQEQNQAVLAALAQEQPAGNGPGRFTDAPIVAAREQLAASYDPQHHGFGGAPKFPHPSNLELLLRLGVNDEEAQRMALDTLRTMARGGLQDQLGGGFFRYSVDAQWAIPHFEKMLYDNGPLLSLYTDAWHLSGDDEFAATAAAVGDWVLREMQHPDGGYYATQDADSEGEEGKFYLWDNAEVQAVLNDEEYRVAAAHYGLNLPPNFEGRWHLQATVPPGRIATDLDISPAQVAAQLASARRSLFETRARRAPPGRDEKILTAWNGLMIRGMARAGRLLGRDDLVASAGRAVNFIHRNMLRDGRLFASWKDGQARYRGYLDDYAFLLDGLLELLQVRWRDADIGFAIALAEALLDYFEDETNGGFFFTADDHEKLIQRPKPLADEAIPSGNGVAARALFRLGHLLGNLNYIGAAEATLRAAWPAIAEAPYAHASLLLALDEQLHPGATLVMRGDKVALAQWQAHVAGIFRPKLFSVAIPPDARELPGLLAERKAGLSPVAYLCSGHSCNPPLHTPEALDHALCTPLADTFT